LSARRLFTSGVTAAETAESFAEVNAMFADALDDMLLASAPSRDSYGLTVILNLAARGSGQPQEERWLSREDRTEYVSRFTSPYRWLDGSRSDRIEQFAEAVLAAIRGTASRLVAPEELMALADAVETVRRELLKRPRTT
jgi:hypothetical protein